MFVSFGYLHYPTLQYKYFWVTWLTFFNKWLANHPFSLPHKKMISSLRACKLQLNRKGDNNNSCLRSETCFKETVKYPL